MTEGGTEGETLQLVARLASARVRGGFVTRYEAIDVCEKFHGGVLDLAGALDRLGGGR